MRKVLFTFILIILLFTLNLGCSKESENIPQVPGAQHMGKLETSIVGISDFSPNGKILGGMGILGLFSVSIDPNGLNADLSSVREISSTDVLEVVDITNFLQLAPCINCVKIKSVGRDADGHFVLSIGIKHPFDAGDPLKPISGRNRADLHVFNVEGIVISDSAGINFTKLGQSISGVKLINADGYTGYLDASLDEIFPTSATIHPYVLHFDDYSAGNFSPSNPMGFASVTNPPPSGNLVMPMGCNYDYQDYVFAFNNENQNYSFMFAVGCTYGVSANTKNDRFTPEYRIPQHNKKAASEVTVEVISNSLIAGNTSSTAEIEIRVVDISHGVEVGSALNQMLSDSSVSNIHVFVPGIMNNSLAISGGSAISGSGHSPLDPLIYRTVITNSAGGGSGDYTGLVKVLDSYRPGHNTSPLLGGRDGIKRVDPVANPLTGLFTISEFATYQTFEISIISTCGPISGSILSPSCPVVGISNNQSFNFTVEASSANGGNPIVLYEVDFNYDGVSFTTDATSTNGVFNSIGPFVVPNPCPSNIPYDFTVAFRATDSCTPPNTTIFATCTVTVDNCFQWKNIPLRQGVAAKDLAVTPQGDLLILYDDGQVWKYFESSIFSHSAAQYLFTAQVVQWSNLTPPPTPVIANAFIDVSEIGNIFASNANGNICNYPIGYWPCQSFSSTGTPLGQGGAHCTGGPITEVFCYESGSGGWANDHVVLAPANNGNQSNMYRQYDGGWGWVQQYGQNCHGSGYDKIKNIDVVGVESCSTNQFWALEDYPDYYCARFIQSDFFYYYYDNAYFGIGVKTDSDNGWNEAKDLTMDSRDNLYVLDKLSNGKGRVKGFKGSATGGTSLGHFDVPDDIDSTPLRIEGSDVSGAYGNLIFILHGSPAKGYYLSVFLPSEIPW